MSKTKGELVAAAFRKATISGITTQPTGDELAGAVETLEDMMRELESKNACTAYNYEDEPCLSTDSNLAPKWNHAVQSRLGLLLCSDYGIQPSATLERQAAQAWSSMIGKLTLPRQNVQPRTMPRGSGNTARLGQQWSRYYYGDDRAPLDCNTIRMRVGEFNTYTVTIDAFLSSGETVASYATKDVTAGVTVTGEAISADEQGLTFDVTASSTGKHSFVIEFTTSLGRIYPEKVVFSIEDL